MTRQHTGSAAQFHPLDLDAATRRQLWKELSERIEAYWREVEALPVSPSLEVAAIRHVAESFDFESAMSPGDALQQVFAEMEQRQVHTPHPMYFGLFNPAPTAMSVAADALVAALNPQLAAWSHSPFAAEVERHLVRVFGAKFGLPLEGVDGVFTSGGAEANQTAVLAALHSRWPSIAKDGLRSLEKQPVLYVSAEGHHSFLKAARVAGLGEDAVRQIPSIANLQIDMDALAKRIEQDRSARYAPFMIVATAGTTGAGIVDPLPGAAQIAAREGLWFHVDAAWGGAAALSPRLRPTLKGIERADSITFDPHKWLSVSMSSGMFLTRHPELLQQVFGVHTAYMPKEGRALSITDAFGHSMQWSRRFMGLKLFLSLAVAGWRGYAETIEHQAAMGDLLRTRLAEEGWRIVNETPLPLVCFTDAEENWDLAMCQKVADTVVQSGKAWLSTIQLGQKKEPALRACITNYKTQTQHIEALVLLLREVRLSLQT